MGKRLGIVVYLDRTVADEAAVRPADARNIYIDDSVAAEFRLDTHSEYALEKALRLKKERGGGARVVAVALGPEGAERILRGALAAGADSAVRAWDDSVAARGPYLKARALAAAIREMDFDVVLCGASGADGCGGFIAAAIAEELKLPFLSRIRDIEIEPDGACAALTVKSGALAMKYRSELPAVFTVSAGRSCPAAPVNRIRWANRENITVIGRGSPGFPEAGPSVETDRYTYPKPRDKRALSAVSGLPPLERFRSVLYGGISARADRITAEGPAPETAAKLFEWLCAEKII